MLFPPWLTLPCMMLDILQKENGIYLRSAHQLQEGIPNHCSKRYSVLSIEQLWQATRNLCCMIMSHWTALSSRIVMPKLRPATR